MEIIPRPYLVRLKESMIINTSRLKPNGNLTAVPLHLFYPILEILEILEIFAWLYIVCIFIF